MNKVNKEDVMKARESKTLVLVVALAAAAMMLIGCGEPDRVQYVDQDGDDFEAWANGGDDCNDQDPSVYPGAPEVCNNVDDNCDGWVDEDFEDEDGDGVADCAQVQVEVHVDGDGDGGTDADGDSDDACPECPAEDPTDPRWCEVTLQMGGSLELWIRGQRVERYTHFTWRCERGAVCDLHTTPVNMEDLDEVWAPIPSGYNSVSPRMNGSDGGWPNLADCHYPDRRVQWVESPAGGRIDFWF